MKPLTRTYRTLLRAHGPQRWWPGDTPFEVMVGAVLTQNTAWTNVEKAIANLQAADALRAEAIVATEPLQLASWLKPSGYFNVKAKRLRAFCAWYLAQGGFDALARRDTASLRADLLAVHGIGAETADDILLYAFARPVFVIDAYTRRIFARLGLIAGDEPYEELRAWCERHIRADVQTYNEYHALIVVHGKDVCRPTPRCGQCVLRPHCKGPAAMAVPA